MRAGAGGGPVTGGVLLGALFMLLVASSASAGPATDQLRVGTDRVLKTLADPALQGPDRVAERQKALREITDPMFDWAEMARRALGRHWQTRTDAERQEFVPLFRNLLARTYATRIERYDGEQITDYRMVRGPDGRWLIYDVLIEGVSLVANYRSQFDQIIRTASYERLVEKLKSPSS